MASFEIAKEKVLNLEGGYVDNPNDRGKETYKGISRRWFPNWPGWKLIDIKKNQTNFPANLEKDTSLQLLVIDFYREEFWFNIKLDMLSNQEVATEVFDCALNCGIDFAIKSLQRTVNILNKAQKSWKNIAVDGKIGKETMGIVNAIVDQQLIVKVLNLYQAARYIGICEKDESQEVFFAGWINKRVQLNVI